VQAEEPEEIWYWPKGQLAHALIDAPVVARYVPATQLEHDVEPVEIWYCPDAQSAQTEAPAPDAYFPIKQLPQAFVADPVTPREVPAVHAAQPDEADAVWY
jgi:hypothetical protein